MKKIIFTTGLFCYFMIPTFSQINSNLKIDTTFSTWSIYNSQKPCNYGIVKDYKIQRLDSSYYNILFSNKMLVLSQDSVRKIAKTQSLDNIPCVNPQGFFPMEVYVPDSTMKYSMRIEK
jgi:hypothetical protein